MNLLASSTEFGSAAPCVSFRDACIAITRDTPDCGVAARTFSKLGSEVCIMKGWESGRERQLDPERGAAADLRSKVYRTVVELNNSEGARESDSASAGPRRKK